MRCPFCSHEDSRVVDSRVVEDGLQIRRRRECPACNERFSTNEIAEVKLPAISKRDGRREAFAEAKLRVGVERALEKRPIPAAKIDALIGRIVRRLKSSGEREISARQLGDWVMHELRGLDPVAYVRFASVYQGFEDIADFVAAIAQVERTPPEELRERQFDLLAEPEPDLVPLRRSRN